jgi:hypothetical protein
VGLESDVLVSNPDATAAAAVQVVFAKPDGTTVTRS